MPILLHADRPRESVIGPGKIYRLSVDDVVLDEQNQVSGILVDVGGFLGIGQHTVNLPINDAQIGWNQSEDDVRVMVSRSGEQLESMPEHDG